MRSCSGHQRETEMFLFFLSPEHDLSKSNHLVMFVCL